MIAGQTVEKFMRNGFLKISQGLRHLRKTCPKEPLSQIDLCSVGVGTGITFFVHGCLCKYDAIRDGKRITAFGTNLFNSCHSCINGSLFLIGPVQCLLRSECFQLCQCGVQLLHTEVQIILSEIIKIIPVGEKQLCRLFRVRKPIIESTILRRAECG